MPGDDNSRTDVTIIGKYFIAYISHETKSRVQFEVGLTFLVSRSINVLQCLSKATLNYQRLILGVQMFFVALISGNAKLSQ